jgi:hypothetical protein
MKTFVIQANFALKALDTQIVLRDIGSQLTEYFYGKKLTTGPHGCLGAAANIVKKKIDKDTRVEIHIPSKHWKEDNKMKQYIQNVSKHAAREGYIVKIVEI